MSVVACKVTKDKIYLAADSQLTKGNYKCRGLKYNKIRKIKGLVVCVAGTCAEADMFIQYIRENEFPYRKRDIPTFMADFYKRRDKINAKLVPEGKDDISNCTFMIIMNNNAYQVSDLFVTKIVDIFAIGSGEAYAMGAMGMGATVEEAVAVACEYNIECSLPLVYMEIDR